MGHILRKLNFGIWNIGIVEDDVGNILESPGGIEIRWMEHGYKDRFFADPFLLSQDEGSYTILAEEFSFFRGKGIIVRLTVNRETMVLEEREVFLEGDNHLSYPMITKDGVMPEQYRSGATYVYNLDGGIREKLGDMGLIDPTPLDHDGNQWIFATRIVKDRQEAKSHLYAYRLDGGRLTQPISNPVKIDIGSSRPGGGFFRIGKILYRPAQDSSQIYGGQIRIMKVIKLGDDGFQEVEVCRVSSHGSCRFNKGLHTFNVYEGLILVDGYEEQRHPVLKPLSKLVMLLRRHLS